MQDVVFASLKLQNMVEQPSIWAITFESAVHID
jgi:hypothetical protein